jgi:hypothetical protein
MTYVSVTTVDDAPALHLPCTCPVAALRLPCACPVPHRQHRQPTLLAYAAAPAVFPEHASITTRGQQVFCTALAQEGEGLLDAKTFTWLDGSQLRRGTSYLLASGSIISLGARLC